MMSDRIFNSRESGGKYDGLQVAIPAPRKYALSSSSLLPVQWTKIDFGSGSRRPYNRPQRDEADYDFKTVVFNQTKQIEGMLKMQTQQLQQNEALKEYTDTAIAQLRSDLETRNALLENRILRLEARAWESASETCNSHAPSPFVSEPLELPSNENLPFNIVHVQGAGQSANSSNNHRCPHCAKVFSTAKYTKLHIRSICKLTPLEEQDISQRCRRAEKRLCILCRKSYGGNYISRHKCNFSFGFN